MRAMGGTVLAMLSISLVWAGDNADFKPLQGKWLPVSGEMAGQALPEEFLKAARLTITKNSYHVVAGDQVDAGVLKLDNSKKPRAMDITGTDGPNKGKTILAIYEVKGESLRICYALEGKDRPKEFKTLPKTPLLMVTYKRGK